MTDCREVKVEKSKLLLHSVYVHEAVIVLSATSVPARCTELFVVIGRVSFAAPLCVRREEPTVGLTFRSKL